MNQLTVTDNEELGRRLDAVRDLLNKPLSIWAQAYWTQVERSLERAWKYHVFRRDFA
mgnify:CR=1 FL=1